MYDEPGLVALSDHQTDPIEAQENPADPAAIVDQAMAEGRLAEQRVRTETPLELAAQVKRLWDMTAETADFKAACERQVKDLIALAGGTQDEIDDDSQVTVNWIYRNAIQTVAMTVPEEHGVKWKPKEMMEPLPGEPMDPQVAQLKRQATGLGKTMRILCREYAREIDFQEKLEAWVQDAAHNRISILKIMWQSSFEEDQITEERLPDEQDNIAKLRQLLEAYGRGEFTKSDYQWQEVQDLMQSTGKVQLAVRTGFVIEKVDLAHFRCDPRVSGPENFYSAGWMRHDVLMTRAEVLAKWPKINPDDLGSATMFTVDEQGKWNKEARIEQTNPTSQISRPATDTKRMRDEDLLLVAEIQQSDTNTITVLVEGLEYPAAKYPPVRATDQFYNFVPLVLNRFPKSLYGLSDTELQSKLAKASNRMRTDEEVARRDARPRFIYDSGVIDETTMKRLTDGDAGQFLGADFTGKDIRNSIMALQGNHEFRQEEFDDSKFLSAMRAMAALPEQALGTTGTAKFSSEVTTAAAGASILSRYRGTRVTRSLTKLYDFMGQMILFHCGQDQAVDMAGPLAAKYYPAEVPDRRSIYKMLNVQVEVNLDQQLDQAKQAENLAKVITGAAQMGARIPASAGAKILAKLLGEEEAADLFQPDPNMLVGDLASSLNDQGGIQALAPETLMALVQIGEQAKQAAMQMAAQAMGGAPGAAPGAPPAPGMPPGGGPPPDLAPAGNPPAFPNSSPLNPQAAP